MEKSSTRARTNTFPGPRTRAFPRGSRSHLRGTPLRASPPVVVLRNPRRHSAMPAVVEPIQGCKPASAADGSSEFDKQSWLIAVGLAVLAAFSNNFGVNLQKLAWTKKQQGEVGQSVYRSYWLFGMVCIILASLFDFAALGFGPQSVIAPIGSLTMVANVLVAPVMHGEKLRRSMFGATLLILSGCVLAVMSASHLNVICDVESLLSLYWTRRFVAYFVTIVAFVTLVLNFIQRAEDVERELGPASPAYVRLFPYHRIAYALLSGVFGAQSVLFARSFNELIISSMRGHRFFLSYPGAYAIFGSLAGCIVLQIYYLNQGLARFESLYNVPVFTTTFIVGTVLGGGIFYGEFSDFSVKQAILFPFGVALCVSGVFLLVWQTPAATSSSSSARSSSVHRRRSSVGLIPEAADHADAQSALLTA
jgi:hypothetical protein